MKENRISNYVFVLVAQVNKEMEIERELSSLMAKRNIRPCYTQVLSMPVTNLINESKKIFQRTDVVTVGNINLPTIRKQITTKQESFS